MHELPPSCSQHMGPSFSSSSRQKLGATLASSLSSHTLQANHEQIPAGSTAKCTRDLTPDHAVSVARASSGPGHSRFLPHCYKSILTNLLASSPAFSPPPPLHLFSREPARGMPLKCKSDHVILQLKISLRAKDEILKGRPARDLVLDVSLMSPSHPTPHFSAGTLASLRFPEVHAHFHTCCDSAGGISPAEISGSSSFSFVLKCLLLSLTSLNERGTNPSPHFHPDTFSLIFPQHILPPDMLHMYLFIIYLPPCLPPKCMQHEGGEFEHLTGTS